MSDNALPTATWQPPQPVSIPLIPNDLQHLTPLVDQSFIDGYLYDLRSTVAAHASLITNDPNSIGIAVLVTSELAINAIRHGGGEARIRLWQVGGDLYIQVADQGPGMRDPAAGMTPPEPGQAHHRGLWIVRELADHVDIDTGPSGTSVLVHLRVGAPNDRSAEA